MLPSLLLHSSPSLPTSIKELLTQTQHTFLESYRLSLQSQRQSELEKRVRQAIEEAEHELPPPRNVVPLLRARWIIVCYDIIIVTCTGCLFSEHSLLPLPSLDSSLHRLVPFGPYPPTDCQLSVWRPGEAVRGVIQEGKVLRMFNINATTSRDMCVGGCGCGSMCICVCGWLGV